MSCSRHRVVWRMIEQEPMIAEEQTAAVIGVVLWPERERCEPRRSGDSCPHLLTGLAAVLRSQVDQELTVRREIRPLFVDATVKPLAALERVPLDLPADGLHPFRWSTTQEQRDRCPRCRQESQTRR